MKDHLSAIEMLEEVGRIGYYAHGSYISRCIRCKRMFEGDKRAVNCLPCAVKSMGSAVPSSIERCAKIADASHDRNLAEALKARTDAGQAIFDSAQATAATIAADIRKLLPSQIEERDSATPSTQHGTQEA